MIDGSLNEFLDLMSFGDELWFLYKGHKYFLEGWDKDNQSYMFLYDFTEDSNDEAIAVWKDIQPTMALCKEHFLEQPIFDGKTFLEVESDVQWID